MVFKVIKNVLAGMGGVPLMLTLLIGSSISAGISLEFVVLPVVLTSIIHIILNPKSVVVVSFPISLTAVLYQMSSSAGLYNPFITFLIPAVVFIGLSFIKNIQWFVDKIPTNLIAGTLFALGALFIIRQMHFATGMTQFTRESFEYDFYWPGLILCLLIPIITFLLQWKWNKFPWLWAVATSLGVIGSFIPYHKPEMPTNYLWPVIEFPQVHDFDIEILVASVKTGFFITLILLADFLVFNSVIDRFKYSDQNKPNRSMLALGLGNFLSTFIGGIPSSISATHTIHLGENKATNGISVGVMVVCMLVLIFVPLPISPGRHNYIMAGILFYLAIRFIIQGIKILKGTKIYEIIFSIIVMLTILLLDLQKGFIVGAVVGIIGYLIDRKKKDEAMIEKPKE